MFHPLIKLLIYYSDEAGNNRSLPLQVRYGKSPSTNDERCALQGTSGLRHADDTEGRCERTIQGRDTAAGRVDGYGFCVSEILPRR